MSRGVPGEREGGRGGEKEGRRRGGKGKGGEGVPESPNPQLASLYSSEGYYLHRDQVPYLTPTGRNHTWLHLFCIHYDFGRGTNPFSSVRCRYLIPTNFDKVDEGTRNLNKKLS